MSKENKHKVADVECPVCGTTLNRARGTTNTEEAPRENDISVCAYCTAVMVFDSDLKTRVITDQEFTAIKQQAPDLYDELNSAIKLIQNHRGKPSSLFNS
jgi:hypothetical protein